MKKSALILLLITIILVFSIWVHKNTKLIIISQSDCSHVAQLYYEDNSNKIYTYCLSDLKVKTLFNEVSLDKYLQNHSINSLIKNLDVKDAFFDGGTKMYAKDNVTIIQCNTLSGNKDIYIGNSNMKFKSNFCQDNNLTFTKTYKILNVEPYTEPQYENGLLVTYGNSLKIQLSQCDGQVESVIVNNYYGDFILGENYEFEFQIYPNSNDFIPEDIKHIFDNYSIVEIRRVYLSCDNDI